MNQIHFDIKICGLVQGVGFRQSCHEKAVELGITGWVRNNPGGIVSISAEGNEKNLDDFISWCRHGPQTALVEKVSVKRGKINNYQSFIIS